MVIPANKAHLAKGLEPIGIGIAARTKINANIGKSAVSSDSQCELEKLIAGRPLRGRHRDGPLHRRRRSTPCASRIIEAATVPVGTVPIYQVAQQLDDIVDMRPQDFLDVVEQQARQGVDYMTIHCRVAPRALAADRAAADGHRQPRRLAGGQVDDWPTASRTRSTPTSTTCATSCTSTT